MYTSSASSDPKQSNQAPSSSYSVSRSSLVSVEHPYIVRNYAKAIETLGGPVKVNELTSSGRAKNQAGLYFRPANKGPPSVFSGNISTQNLLVEISVPRRTGRKRRRQASGLYQEPGDQSKEGQDWEPYEHDSDPTGIKQTGDTQYLLRSLQDNTKNYGVHVIGQIEQTHRFRSIPDFVFSTTNNSFMQKFRDTIEPLNYDAAKKFHFDLSKGTQPHHDLVPPPVFTQNDLPFNYSYRQNASVRQLADSSGNIKTFNESASRRLKTHRVAFDCADVPLGPMEGIPPLDTLGGDTKRLIQEVNSLLDRRPIWSRRALSNQMKNEDWLSLGRYVYQYVSYEFVSGPWRDVIVKYGIDPRRDPKYRIYQSMIFQFDDEGTILRASGSMPQRGGARVKRLVSSLMPGKTGNSGPQSHIFDGTKLARDGKTWQVCDISDPLVRDILGTTNIRETCHIKTDGWYHNGTWAKAKTILKSKMGSFIDGSDPLSPTDYAQLARIPDIILPTTNLTTLLGTYFANSHVFSLASHVKSMASHHLERDKSKDEPTDTIDLDSENIRDIQEDIRIGSDPGEGDSRESSEDEEEEYESDENEVEVEGEDNTEQEEGLEEGKEGEEDGV